MPRDKKDHRNGVHIDNYFIVPSDTRKPVFTVAELKKKAPKGVKSGLVAGDSGIHYIAADVHIDKKYERVFVRIGTQAFLTRAEAEAVRVKKLQKKIAGIKKQLGLAETALAEAKAWADANPVL